MSAPPISAPHVTAAMLVNVRRLQAIGIEINPVIDGLVGDGFAPGEIITAVEFLIARYLPAEDRA